MRLTLDVRRLWRCPRCGAERKLPGRRTTARCRCEHPRPFMRLIEQPRPPRPEPKPLNLYFQADEQLADATPADSEAGGNVAWDESLDDTKTPADALAATVDSGGQKSVASSGVAEADADEDETAGPAPTDAAVEQSSPSSEQPAAHSGKGKRKGRGKKRRGRRRRGGGRTDS